jgi:hypothetical protein
MSIGSWEKPIHCLLHLYERSVSFNDKVNVEIKSVKYKYFRQLRCLYHGLVGIFVCF